MKKQLWETESFILGQEAAGTFRLPAASFPGMNYLTVMVTVALLGKVSVPPGPNVIDPVEVKTEPCGVVAGGVILVVTIMVCGGFAPPLVDPPRLGVVISIRPPSVVLNDPGQGTLRPPVGVKVQTNDPPLLIVTAMLLSCIPAGMVFLKTTF